MYADHLLRPWLEPLLTEHPGVRISDAHTHVGENGPSGFSATAAELEDPTPRSTTRAATELGAWTW